MRISNLTLGVTAAIAVVVVAIVAVLDYTLNKPLAGSPQSAATSVSQNNAQGGQTYTNPSFGYTVTIPSGLESKEITPEFVSVGSSDGGSYVAKADIAVLHAGLSDPLPSFDDFTMLAARLACQGGTPDAKVTCATLASSKPFTTSSGLSGKELYLKAMLSGSAGSKSVTRGPFYAFNVSSLSKQDKYAVLLIYPPSDSAQASIDPSLIAQLASSLVVKS